MNDVLALLVHWPVHVCLKVVFLYLILPLPPSQMDFLLRSVFYLCNAHFSFIQSVSMSILHYLNYEQICTLKSFSVDRIKQTWQKGPVKLIQQVKIAHLNSLSQICSILSF